MSEDKTRVTVLCPDETLAARIRDADKTGQLQVTVPADDRPIYEYRPALYVHVPVARDLETARRRRPYTPGPPPLEADPETRLHKGLDAHGPSAPDFEGVGGCNRLWAAIREGHVLALAFAEKFVIDAAVRRRQREMEGFTEQLRVLDADLERRRQEIVAQQERGLRSSAANVAALLARLGGWHVREAHKQADRWVRCHHLDSRPTEPDYGQGFDVKRARAEFERLRVWFEGTKGWTYTSRVLCGLLPEPSLFEAGFIFPQQVIPDHKPQATSAAVEWVQRHFPFLVPELTVRVEQHPAPRTPSALVPGGVPPTMPAGHPAAERIRARILAQAPSAEKATAQLYEVDPAEVRIEPLVVNAVGEAFGIAVRIRKGAVLVLPECRDEGAKAALVVKLATELWGPIQGWLQESPVSAEQATEKSANRVSSPSGEQSGTAPPPPPVAGHKGEKATPRIMGPEYRPDPNEDWYGPMTMAEIARRLDLDPRTAQEELAETGLQRVSRQKWKVRLDTLPATQRKKVQTRPRKTAE
jgi:hypothetical protein